MVVLKLKDVKIGEYFCFNRSKRIGDIYKKTSKRLIEIIKPTPKNFPINHSYNASMDNLEVTVVQINDNMQRIFKL